MSSELYQLGKNPTQLERPVDIEWADEPLLAEITPSPGGPHESFDFLGGVVQFETEATSLEGHERQLAAFVIKGASYADISTQAQLNIRKLKRYLGELYDKVDVPSRSGLLYGLLTHQPPLAFISRWAEPRKGYTEDQRSVLELAVLGITTAQIAARLETSANTIRDRLRVMSKRNGLHNRDQLASHGILSGIVHVPAEAVKAAALPPHRQPANELPSLRPEKRALIPPPPQRPPALLDQQNCETARPLPSWQLSAAKESPDSAKSLDPHDPRLIEFASLVSVTRPLLNKHLERRVGGEAALAEDLTQETFVRALRHFDRFMNIPPDERMLWLYRVASNIVADYFKSGRYRYEKSYDDDHRLTLAIYNAAGEQDVCAETEKIIDIQRALAAFWDELSFRQRQLLLYRFYYDIPPTEIAAIMGQPTSAIKSALTRAKESARRLAGQNGYSYEAAS